MRDTDFDLRQAAFITCIISGDQLTSRTMALMDLHKELSRQPAAVVVDPTTSASASRSRQEIVFIQDEAVERMLCDEVMKLLNDSNSEVKNVAVNW